MMLPSRYRFSLWVSAAAIAIAGSSELISTCADKSAGCASEQDKDRLSLIQDQLSLSGRRALNKLEPKPDAKGLDDWDKEFISDKQGGPYYGESTTLTTIKKTTIAQRAEKKQGTTPSPVSATKASPTTPPEAVVKTKSAESSSPSSLKQPGSVFITSTPSAIVAVSLVGVCFFCAILLCYTQFKVDRQKPLVWYILSSFSAVFCAALLCTAIRNIVAWLPQVLEVKGVDSWKMDLLRLPVVYLVLQVLLFAAKNSFWLLEGIGAVGGFVLGFAATEALGSLMLLDEFSSSWLIVGMSVLAFTMCTLVLLLCLTRFRECCSNSEAWITVCGEVELVAVAVGLGSFFSKVITCVILGSLNPIREASTAVSLLDALTLFAVAIGIMGLLLMSLRVLYHGDLSDENAGPIELLVLYTAGMTGAWCFLTAGQWIFWDGLLIGASGVNSQVSERVLMAGTFTAAAVLVLLVLIVLGMGGERGQHLQVVSCSTALLLGLSWEACFVKAAQGYGRLVQACLCVALCLLFLTAWGFYILPHAVHKKWLFGASEDGPKGAAMPVLTMPQYRTPNEEASRGPVPSVQNMQYRSPAPAMAQAMRPVVSSSR